jgi:hypothetical protein
VHHKPPPDRIANVWAAFGRSEFSIALSDLRALDGEVQALAETTT